MLLWWCHNRFLYWIKSQLIKHISLVSYPPGTSLLLLPTVSQCLALSFQQHPGVDPHSTLHSSSHTHHHPLCVFTCETGVFFTFSQLRQSAVAAPVPTCTKPRLWQDFFFFFFCQNQSSWWGRTLDLLSLSPFPDGYLSGRISPSRFIYVLMVFVLERGA